MLRESDNLNELRSLIIDWANSTNDEKSLKKTAKAIAKSSEDWWDELPSAQQKRIVKALKNAAERKNLSAHEEVFKKAKQQAKERAAK